MGSRLFFAGFAAILALGATLPFLAPPAHARPMTPAERRDLPLSADMPGCADPMVLARISSRFDAREGEYWDSGLSIAGFDRVAEIGYRSNGLDYVPRRYCTARAIFSDGGARKVTYAIASDLGWLGVLGYGVEWCVDGLDRNRAYGANCRAARP
ncbi:MAG TPA: hypothetical protein PKA55_19725 [Rhodoblastus sp.]|nr:hypothetical protein [Rhodoblastus sp.]